MNVARRPDLFIIGAPKSGTTSLYEYLSGHPQVFMSPTKEPFYFCSDARVGPRPRLEYPADAAVGRSNHAYPGSHEAPRLVRDFSVDAYIVATSIAATGRRRLPCITAGTDHATACVPWPIRGSAGWSAVVPCQR